MAVGDRSQARQARQRVCYCDRCAKFPLGYQSVSNATYTRHNPLRKANAGANVPRMPLTVQAANNRSPTPEPTLYSDYEDNPGFEDGSDSVMDYVAENSLGDFPSFEEDGPVLLEAGDEIADEWSGRDSDLEDYDPDNFDDQDDDHDGRENSYGYDSDDDPDDRPNPYNILFDRRAPGFPHHNLPPSLRQLYTSIAYGKAVGMSVAVANAQLDAMTTAVELERGEVLDNRTNKVKTALRRLGIDPDEHIQRYIVCPKTSCWAMYKYKDLYTIESPLCEDCGTPIYRSINHVRVPYKIMPYSKLSTFLRRLLQDESVRHRLHDWRTNDEDRGPQWGLPIPSVLDPAYDIDTPLEGLSHGSAWRSIRTGEERVLWPDFEVTSELLPGQTSQRFVGKLGGLLIILNCDWFAVKGLIGSSVGAIYATIANLPRDIAFKRKNTALLCIIPGPKEPGPECFAKVLNPIVEDLQQCERGVEVKLNTTGAALVYTTRVLLCASDLLAAKKLVGVVAHSHKKHPCHQCRITKAEINTPKAYDWRNLESFEPSTLLKRAFEYERATPERKAAIEEEYGVRFSPLLRLQGMEHAGSSPVDPLHNSFLGIAKAFVNMLFKHDIFSEEEDRQVFMAVFEKACYPGHLGRLPSRITKQFASDRRLAGSGLKADQWKRIIQVLPIALFVALRDPENDQIDDVDQEPIDFQAREPTPLPNGRARKRKRQSDVRRNSREWYRVAIMICSALSTLHSHTISIREAMSAVDDLAGASTAILAMGETLTINWHIAMHYVDAVRRFGPLSGFATWAFERNNGALSRVKHNGQERDVPSTLLRSWELEAGLATIIHTPPPDASEIERAGLATWTNNNELARGTLMLNEARGVAANRTIRLPVAYQKGLVVSLAQHPGSYRALLEFMALNHPELNLKDEAFWDTDEGVVLPVRSSAYSLYTHAVYNGYKFCSLLWSRSRRDAFALASVGGVARHLVKIHLILQVDLKDVHLKRTLALVQFYRAAEGDYPWASRQIDLGIRIYREELLPKCFIALEELEAATIVSRIDTQQDGACIVSMSCDRDGPEPEFWLETDNAEDLQQVLDDEDQDDDN